MRFFIFIICLVLPVGSTAANSQQRYQERIEDAIQALKTDPHVQSLHKVFRKRVERVREAPSIFSASGLSPSPDCITDMRKKLGPPPPEDWQIDLVKIICQNERVRDETKKLESEIQKSTIPLYRVERRLRFTKLINAVVSEWVSGIQANAKTFQTKCGLDEVCLEKKQLARYRSLILSGAALENIWYLEAMLGVYPEKKKTPEQENANASLIALIAESRRSIHKEIRHTYLQLGQKVDLPW